MGGVEQNHINTSTHRLGRNGGEKGRLGYGWGGAGRVG